LIFISYAHEDENYITEFRPFLKVLEREYNIAFWYDRKIPGGSNWEEEIRNHMSRARVALLLVSQDFIASDFIHHEELPELTRAAKKDGATLLWLPISHCTWESTSIAEFQSAACTNPSHPLSEMEKAEKDLVYKKLFLEIKDAFSKSSNIKSVDCQQTVAMPQSPVTADRKHAIISFLKEDEKLNVRDLSTKLGLSENRVRALLREMVNDGIIEKVGNNRHVYYVLG